MQVSGVPHPRSLSNVLKNDHCIYVFCVVQVQKESSRAEAEKNAMERKLATLNYAVSTFKRGAHKCMRRTNSTVLSNKVQKSALEEIIEGLDSYMAECGI